MLVRDVLLDFTEAGVTISHAFNFAAAHHFLVDLAFEVTELLLPVGFFLFKKACFPLPEGHLVELLKFDLTFVFLELGLRVADNFNHAGFCLVNSASASPHDARKATRLLLEARRDILHQVDTSISVLQVPIQDDHRLGSVCLRLVYQTLHEGPHRLCLLDGGGDPLVREKRGGQVLVHHLAVLGLPTKLEFVVAVSHI